MGDVGKGWGKSKSDVRARTTYNTRAYMADVRQPDQAVAGEGAPDDSKAQD